MRITNQMLTETFRQNLRTNLRNLDKVQRQLSSGKAISRPSDDPVRLQQILRMDTALIQTNQYLRNIDDAHSWLSATEAALGQGNAVLHRARDLTLQGLNGSNDQEAMNALAMEMGQLLEQLGNVANSSHASRYLFAGADTTVQPYTVALGANGSTIESHAQDSTIEYEIGPNVTMKINVTGQDAFGGEETFQILENLRVALQADDKEQLDDLLGQLDSALNRLLTARADAGARMNRLEATKSRFEDDVVNLTALKSKAEDADIAEVIMQLTTQESVYRASLAAGARIMQPSLIDYLR